MQAAERAPARVAATDPVLVHIKRAYKHFPIGGFGGLAVRAVDLGVAQPSRGLDARQVLAAQPGLGAPGADPVQVQRPASPHRERERRPQDLPAAFALRSIDGNHDRGGERIAALPVVIQSSGRSPCGAIFTSFGSNRPSTSTKSA